MILLDIALGAIAVGSSVGWAWQRHRDRELVEYAQEQLQHDTPSAVVHDIHTIRHEAQAEMLRAAAEWRRSQ